jgi:hypothetical protein
MSETTHSDFVAASKAAECWIKTVRLVPMMREGDVDTLYRHLLRSTRDDYPDNLATSYAIHAECLEARFDELAGISDGPITWRDLLGLKESEPTPFGFFPRAWSSAHEAAAGIALATLELLVDPLWIMADLAKAASSDYVNNEESQTALARRLLKQYRPVLTFAAGPLESFKERLRRERSVLLNRRVVEERKEPKRRSRRGPTVNERMASMLQEDPTRLDWTAAEWAQRLEASLERSVTATAVKLTPTWKGTIRAARAIDEANGATRRGR